MKKFLLILAMSVLIFPMAFSQEDSEDVVLNPKTGFPEITEKPFLTFDYGPSVSWVTRVQKQTGRSNFALEHTMVGLYCTMRLENMMPVDSMLRVAAYYPMVSTFNKVPQTSKQTLLYAFDLFYGPVFEADMWKYVRIEFAPGFHFLYQLSDNWHYMSVGIAGMLGTEFPIAQRWTVTLNGLASFDYANLGTNAQMFPFDYSWQYQLSLGVRYSKKKPNKYSYITSRKEIKHPDAEQKTDEEISPSHP